MKKPADIEAVTTPEYPHDARRATGRPPDQIVGRVEARLPRTEWDTPAGNVAFLLEEVRYHAEQETDDDDIEPIDEAEVGDRSRSVGTLNE